MHTVKIIKKIDFFEKEFEKFLSSTPKYTAFNLFSIDFLFKIN
jgi:hypothetical protein